MRLAGMMMLAAVAMLSLPASAQVAHTSQLARQVVCQGEASGEHGEQVTVFIHVDPEAGRMPAYASWSPPQLERVGASGLDQPDLSLTLGYDNSDAHSIGKLTNTFVLVSLFSPPRKPISQAKLDARLGSLHPLISYDGAQASKLTFDPSDSRLMAIPGSASRFATFQLPQRLPGEATIILTDNHGKPVLSLRFALRDTAGRDGLYASAWAQADKRAVTLTDCAATTD